MQTHLLPGTDLRVSVIGLGCWALGGEGWGSVSDRDAKDTILAALEAGVTLFDTAPLYGRADEHLRAALGPRLRDVVVASKVGARREAAHAISDLSPSHLRRDLEASLERLGVETIDLLQIHWPCERGTPLEESLQALFRMRDEGKLRYVGLCNYGAADLERAWKVGPIATLQLPLSLLRRENERDIAAAARLGTGVLAYEPLARGLLTGKHRGVPRFAPGDVRASDPRFWALGMARAGPLIESLRREAERRGTTPAALALAWVARREGVTAVLAGARTPAQARENARAAELVTTSSR